MMGALFAITGSSVYLQYGRAQFQLNPTSTIPAEDFASFIGAKEIGCHSCTRTPALPVILQGKSVTVHCGLDQYYKSAVTIPAVLCIELPIPAQPQRHTL